MRRKGRSPSGGLRGGRAGFRRSKRWGSVCHDGRRSGPVLRVLRRPLPNPARPCDDARAGFRRVRVRGAVPLSEPPMGSAVPSRESFRGPSRRPPDLPTSRPSVRRPGHPPGPQPSAALCFRHSRRFRCFRHSRCLRRSRCSRSFGLLLFRPPPARLPSPRPPPALPDRLWAPPAPPPAGPGGPGSGGPAAGARAVTTRPGVRSATPPCAGGRWPTWSPTPAPGCS